MSLFPENVQTIRVRVRTGDPLAEVFLVDHSFALADRAIGMLDSRVAAGVYKIKVRVGEVIAERLVVLDRDLDIDMSTEFAIASSAPLLHTSRCNEGHAAAARAASRQLPSPVGHRSQILLVARYWNPGGRSDSEHTGSAASLTGSPPGRLSVRGPDGTLIADLADISPRITESSSGPAYAAILGVDPGAYLLRWYDLTAGREVEQAVSALADWQTQVFLLVEPDELGPHYSVSILLARGGHGFDPADPTAYEVEVARSALATERKVASDHISENLFLNTDNPMLGLYGAHLMLIAKDADKPEVPFSQDYFDSTVGNLADLLGADHPDVVALMTKTSQVDLNALPPVLTLPLIWRSWLLLLSASHDNPALVPVGTWRRASRPLPSRPFLTWMVEDDRDDADSAMSTEVNRVVNSLRPERVSFDLPGAADRGGTRPSIERTRRRLSRQLLIPAAAIDELGTASDSIKIESGPIRLGGLFLYFERALMPAAPMPPGTIPSSHGLAPAATADAGEVVVAVGADEAIWLGFQALDKDRPATVRIRFDRDQPLDAVTGAPWTDVTSKRLHCPPDYALPGVKRATGVLPFQAGDVLTAFVDRPSLAVRIRLVTPTAWTQLTGTQPAPLDPGAAFSGRRLP